MDINEDGLQEVRGACEAAGVQVVHAVGDVADLEQVREAAARGLEALGPVDFVANNAGVAVGGAFNDISTSDWEWIVGINLWGVIHGCRAFLPQLQQSGGGAILNVASAAGLLNAPRMAPYNITKAGVISLSETLAVELADDNIRVSALCPTFFKTGIMDASRGIDSPREHAMVRKLMDRSKLQAPDVARIAIDQTLEGVGVIVPMRDGRWMWRMKRASPALYPGLVRSTYRKLRRRVENR